MDKPDHPVCAALSCDEWREMLDLLRATTAALERQGSRWMTTGEAAKYLRVSPRTLEDLRCKGGGPPYCRQGGKLVTYDREDLDAWRRNGRANHTGAERLAGVHLVGA